MYAFLQQGSMNARSAVACVKGICTKRKDAVQTASHSHSTACPVLHLQGSQAGPGVLVAVACRACTQLNTAWHAACKRCKYPERLTSLAKLEPLQSDRLLLQ
jgi:hypothetical protein